MSYAEMDRDSDRFARDLLARGGGPGDVVAVARTPAATLLVGLLGVLKAGAVCAIVDSADASGTVADIGGLAPGSVAWARRAGPHRTVVACSHLALLNCAAWTTATFSIPAGARIGILPCTDTDALLQAIFTAWWSGGTLCLSPRDERTTNDPYEWLDRGIAVAYGEPAAWRRLKKTGRTLPSLSHAFFVGSVLVREDVMRVRAIAPDVACGYFFACGDRPQHDSCYRVPPGTDALRTIVPVGCGIAGVELGVLNREDQVAGVGERGRISIRTDHGLVATDVLGRFLADGNIDRIGNRSHCDTIDGYTIRFDEIASTLMEHPAVLDAHVALETNGNQTALVALVTADDEHAWPGDALDDFVRQRLAAYLVPRRFVQVASGA
jgi:acyl-coenzyme A synthetase/AMP-(fatty) acid ligase